MVEHKACVVIFLNGVYDSSRTAFYIDAIREAGQKVSVVAVDGALEFFDRLGILPDLIAGDLDSVSPETLARYSDVAKRQFPKDKDFTDGELAVRIAIGEGAGEIKLFGWEAAHGEVDHLFGNAFLLFLAQDLGEEYGTNDLTISLCSPGLEVQAVTDATLVLRGQVGDRLSVVPLTDRLEVKYRGCRFPLLAGSTVMSSFGETRTLRNEFCKTQVEVVIQGKALVIHSYTAR